jgi:small subunit ribosomal protein S19e
MAGRTNQTLLVEKVAVKLKSQIKKPEWASFVKTGAFKQRPPVDADWWYMRAASILRKVSFKGPIGVAKLSTLYGGKKNRGFKPEHHMTGSTNIIRTILQQLEKAELIAKGNRGLHKGRIITPKGKSLLDKTEQELIKQKQA